MEIDRLVYLASLMIEFLEEQLYDENPVEWFGDTFGMTEEEYRKEKAKLTPEQFQEIAASIAKSLEV